MTRERWITTGLVAALLASTVPLVALGNMWSSLLAETIQNIGHIPLFAWLTVLLWLLAARWLGARVWVTGQYLGVFGISLGLNLLTELVQLLGPRDADLWDLLSNGIGTVCALAWLATCDRRLDGKRVRERPLQPLLRAGVVIALIASLIPLIATVNAYRERERRMPVLFDFASSSQKRFLRTKLSWYEFVVPPASWGEAPPPLAMSVSFSELIGGVIVFIEPFSDWSAYDALEFDILHPGHGRIELGLRIDDQHESLRMVDRFARHLFLDPGVNHISIPMKDIERAPAGRLLDLARMRRIVMFPVEPTGDYRIYLGPIRLEGERSREGSSAAESPD